MSFVPSVKVTTPRLEIDEGLTVNPDMYGIAIMV
jgi:hypothetical protein